MRLKPVASQMGFRFVEDRQIGNVQVAKGTTVVTMIRPDAISDAHVANASMFKPERWLDSTDVEMAATSAKRVSMPFGAGPRICPGRYLALLEIKMAMATLQRRFDIPRVGTADGNDPPEHLAFTITRVGLRILLRPRVALGNRI